MRPSSATIVITTKNRKEELRRALESCAKQSFAAEILVIDDGSTDGTSQMVRQEFPNVVLASEAQSRGLIVRRNEAARLASGEIIVSIDDDAEFSDPNIISQTLLDFDDARIGAVAIPFVNVLQSEAIQHQSPSDEGIWITNEFIGTAHAIRKELFQALGGYRESLVHQHEEGDFCVRMLNAGYFVKLGHAKPVFHFESPARSRERMEVYGQRNLLMFAWHNVPMPNLLWHLPMTTFNGLAWGCRTQSLQYRLRGTIEGVKAIFGASRERRPVSRRTNAIYRRLKKEGPTKLNDVDDTNFAHRNSVTK